MFRYGARVAVQTNKQNLINTTTSVFEGSDLHLQLQGQKGFSQSNLFQVILNLVLLLFSQRILNYWNYQNVLSLAQSQNGSSKVIGGVMPEVDLKIINSTHDTITGQVLLNINLPINFNISIGDLLLQGNYQDKVIALATHNDIVVGSSTNINATITLIANDAR